VIGGALGFVVIAGLIYWRAKAKQKLDNAFACAGSNWNASAEHNRKSGTYQP